MIKRNPTVDEVGDGIVRMNCGYDSNVDRRLVVEVAKNYKHVFFNTSVLRLDFPGPVVFTANPEEESGYWTPEDTVDDLSNLMFIRLRVSASNLEQVEVAIREWSRIGVPIVLTFMAYYEQPVVERVHIKAMNNDHDLVEHFQTNDTLLLDTLYQYRKRHVNSYWCPTERFMRYVLQRMKKIGGRHVTMCGLPDSYWCKDCRNCEIYYLQTIKRLKEKGK